MAAEAKPAAPTAAPDLAEAVLARLSTEELKTLNKWRWHDRLVSLWAPVTVLALVFIVYLAIVESLVCTYLWLQPLMQGVGLICFAWWAVLVVARTPLAKRWNHTRDARYRSEEILAEVEQVTKKARAQLKEKAWDEVVAGCEGVVKSFGKPLDEVKAANRVLEATYEKHLKNHRSKMRDLGGGFVRALAIALTFRAVLLDPFKIPSGSMIPTLEIGDQIFVNKFIYGVRLPFTNYVPFKIIRSPKKGDVIVFNNPTNESLDYVKRVVGTPGDKLQFTEEGLLVNGVLQERKVEVERYLYWDQPSWYAEPISNWVKRWPEDDWRQKEETLYRETFDGVPHYILDNVQSRKATLSRQQVTEVVVPEGHVFVMGDNRNNSDDSRFGLGSGTNRPEFVPFGNIKGKATVIWLSMSRDGFGSSFFGGTGIRYDRFFTPVTMCGAEAPRK
ncbi:MAG: signal peptidase I [Archangium sp.]|nr:signal peptidase I [Archangium sp.]